MKYWICWYCGCQITEFHWCCKPCIEGKGQEIWAERDIWYQYNWESEKECDDHPERFRGIWSGDPRYLNEVQWRSLTTWEAL